MSCGKKDCGKPKDAKEAPKPAKKDKGCCK